MIDRDPLAVAVILAVGTIVPRLKTLADRHATDIEKELWPAGAPPGITWTMVHEQQLTALRASTEKLVAYDLAVAERRGRPWPGGASIRRETAVRLQLADELIARAKSIDVRSTIDGMLFSTGEVPPPQGLAKLVELSATLLLAISRKMFEGGVEVEPLLAATVLARMLGEMLASLRGLVAMAGEEKACKKIDRMLDLMKPIHEAIKKAKGGEPQDEVP